MASIRKKIRTSWFYPIWHFMAVLIGFVRKPGRFSVYHYPRNGALKRLNESKTDLVLDLGCGARRLVEHVVAIDLKPSRYVDSAARAECLPFADQSCDGIWLEAIMEHVPFPDKVLDEADRVLKKGGWLYIEVPFMQGEHAAPGDFRRWTPQGLLQLVDKWHVEWFEAASGPFSAFAYQLRCCLALITSFGNDFLFRVTFEAIWGYFVWPIKYLDVFFRHHPRAIGHAFGYAVMLKKK